MTQFQTALNESFLLRPLLWLSRWDSKAIYENWNRSFIGRKTTFCFDKIETIKSSCRYQPLLNILFHPNILFIGIALLFIFLSFMGTNTIGLLTLGLFAFLLLALLFTRRRFLNSFTVVDLIVLLFFMSVFLSTAFSSYGASSVHGLLKMLTFLAGYTVFRSFYDLEKMGLQKNRLEWLFWILMLLGLGEAVIGYIQSTTELQPLATWQDPGINPELKMTRVFGSLKPSNPNLLAGFLIPCFASACGLKLYYLAKGWRWSFAIGICSIAAMSILISLIMTGSRGGYLALASMLIFVFVMSGHLIFHQAELKMKKWLKGGWLFILVFSLVGGLFIFSTSEKLQNRVTSMFAMREDSSISYRINVYQSAVEMFKDNWLVGIGPGNETFKQAYGLYMVPGYNALGAYSVPLEIAVEQGVFGLSIFLLLMALLTMRVILYMDSKCSLSDKIFVGLLYTGIVGSFVYGIFDTIWYRPSVNLLFWFMVAGISQRTEQMFESSFFKNSTAEKAEVLELS